MTTGRTGRVHGAAAALAATAVLAVALTACTSEYPIAREPTPTAISGDDTLRAFAPEGIKIGSAVAGGGHHEEQSYPDPFTGDEQYRAALAADFTSLTPENQLKWEYLRPAQDTYNFDDADAIIACAQENGQDVRGHALFWHSQNPAWLEQGDFTAEELRGILQDHITTVVTRYAGKIQQWDVANEIFDDAGGLREQDNIWIRELGPEIFADAFRWAHEADPDALLFFNDYNVEQIGPKSNAYYALVQDLLAEGVPVHGFGIQGHLAVQYGVPSMQPNLERFAGLGLQLAVSELDVRVPVQGDSPPADADVATQADYYESMLTACLAVDARTSFTLWGFPDKYSWVPHFFSGEGAATVMWDDFSRKPAYCVLQEQLAEASGTTADAAFTSRGCAA